MNTTSSPRLSLRLLGLALFSSLATGGVTSSLAQTTHTFIPVSGTNPWATPENWTPAGVPNAPDASIILNAGSDAPNLQIEGIMEVGHLEVDMTGAPWQISSTNGSSGIRWATTGGTGPSITDNSSDYKSLTLSVNMFDPTVGAPKALEFHNTGSGNGVIALTGDNTGFTGGFQLHATSPTNIITLGLVYEASAGNNDISIFNAAHRLRFGSGSANTQTFSNNIIIDDSASGVTIFSTTIEGGKAVLTGTISGNGSVEYWAYGGGDLELQGANTYSKNTLIASKLNVIFDGVDNFGTGDKISFAISGGSPSLTYAAGNTDDLTKKADGSRREIDFDHAHVTIDTGGNEVTFANQITSHMSASAGLTKTGNGTLRLAAGDNAYGQTTLVSQGALLAINTTGSATGSSAVIVEGGTFGGTGTSQPGGDREVVFKATGRLSAGDTEIDSGIGTFTIDLSETTGNLRFEEDATLLFDLGSTRTADLVDLVTDRNGSVIFEGARIDLFDRSGGNLEAGGYLLLSASSNAVYSGLTLSGNTITDGLWVNNGIAGWTSSLTLDNGDIYLHLEAIPEPGVVGLFIIASGLLLASRRRSNPSRDSALSI